MYYNENKLKFDPMDFETLIVLQIVLNRHPLKFDPMDFETLI